MSSSAIKQGYGIGQSNMHTTANSQKRVNTHQRLENRHRRANHRRAPFKIAFYQSVLQHKLRTHIAQHQIDTAWL